MAGSIGWADECLCFGSLPSCLSTRAWSSLSASPADGSITLLDRGRNPPRLLCAYPRSTRPTALTGSCFCHHGHNKRRKHQHVQRHKAFSGTVLMRSSPKRLPVQIKTVGQKHISFVINKTKCKLGIRPWRKRKRGSCRNDTRKGRKEAGLSVWMSPTSTAIKCSQSCKHVKTCHFWRSLKERFVQSFKTRRWFIMLHTSRWSVNILRILIFSTQIESTEFTRTSLCGLHTALLQIRRCSGTAGDQPLNSKLFPKSQANQPTERQNKPQKQIFVQLRNHGSHSLTMDQHLSGL